MKASITMQKSYYLTTIIDLTEIIYQRVERRDSYRLHVKEEKYLIFKSMSISHLKLAK